MRRRLVLPDTLRSVGTPRTRREFLGVTLAAVAGRARPGHGGAGPTPAPVIDGLGEVHPEYDDALLDEMRASGMRACVVTAGNPAIHGPSAFDDVKAEVETYDRMVASRSSRLSKATSTAGIDEAVRRGTIALLYYTQNATPLNDDLERLDALRALGVRIVQLTYNTRNLLGDGCLERTNAGLSRFGMEVVQAMNARGMLVDLSHCGEATTRDGIAASRKPVAITHAGCEAVFDHPRTKTDAALRALAENGGVIGIFQINPYLGPAERNTLDTYLDHIDHAVKVAGIEHVGIGSDREHRRIPDTDEAREKLRQEIAQLGPGSTASFRWPFFIGELNHPRRMETIREGLRKRGYGSADVDRILGGNWYRLFRDTIG